jgi:UDP-N-acetylmuramate dehydrogenase
LQIFGAGSNLVPHDSGFDGIVLKLGAGFAWINAEADLFSAGGATLLPRMTHAALANGLGNFEWACGVPGSLGGSIWGNAGARGFDGHEFVSRDCAADLHSLVAYDRLGTRHLLSGHEVVFGYRKSSLHDLIVVAATFKLRPLDDKAVQKHREAVKELLRLRRLSQPVSSASAGCIWKNTKAAGFAGTGQLIESLGLMGTSVGGAQISRLHANFIVNAGHATGDDVRQLARQIEECVKTRTGIILEREARFLDG